MRSQKPGYRLICTVIVMCIALSAPALAAKKKDDCTAGNCRNGTGTMVYADGSRYEGEFKDRLRHGKGTLTHANGVKWIGTFDQGSFTGKGTMIYTDGGRYDGDVKAGVPDGHGVFLYADGTRLDGTFKTGELEQGIRYRQLDEQCSLTVTVEGKVLQGPAVVDCPGESRVEVRYQGDRVTGTGIMTKPDGSHFEGIAHQRPVVISVLKDSQASRIGILQGDLLLAYGDQSLVDTSMAVLRDLVQATAPGTLVPLRLRRNGQEITLTLAAGPLGVQYMMVPYVDPGAAQPRLPVPEKDPPTIALSRGVGIVSTAHYTVHGNATDPSGVAIVQVNGMDARLDANGNFDADILLKPGDNEVTVVAIDTFNNRAVESFNLTREAETQAQGSSASSPATIQTGLYHAILIGVQDYQDESIPDLSEPVQDVERLKEILVSRYTFDADRVELLINPTRGEILDELDALTRTLTSSDNLLIFYAGHGYWDAQTGQGYWLPADARQNRRREWISNSTIVDYVNGIKAKHTLLVSDACFSGGIFKTRSAFSDPPAATSALYSLPSRKAMTSGTLTEVPDKSVFVQYLVKQLEQNEDRYVASEDMFSRFRVAVINNSPVNQVPQFGEIRQTGDEGGDFIFVRK